MKDLYTENCKTLLKKIKEDLSKWKDKHAHRLVDFKLLRSLLWTLGRKKNCFRC